MYQFLKIPHSQMSVRPSQEQMLQLDSAWKAYDVCMRAVRAQRVAAAGQLPTLAQPTTLHTLQQQASNAVQVSHVFSVRWSLQFLEASCNLEAFCNFLTTVRLPTDYIATPC